MRLLYFNPENDLALAANDAHYTPPASARQMARDLQRLPLLWAEKEDLVLLRNEEDSSAASPADVSPVRTLPSLIGTAWGGSSSLQLLPWGWSPLVVRQLRDAGVSASLLPTTEQLADYRAFASRQTAVRLLRHWRAECPEAFGGRGLVGESEWCTTEQEVKDACSRCDGAMLKMPWSGSGRGVHPVEAELTGKDLAWVRRTLVRQGGVEVEPIYNKVQDFAMEFWAEDGRVCYEGLSVFETTAGGVYAGNLVASEAEKENRLSGYVSPGLLREVRCCLETLLSSAGIPRWYSGPIGVDMMVVKLSSPQSSSFHLHPLVEVNMRMTMGWVALRLQQKLSPGEVGTFRIVHSDGHYRALFHKIEA